MSRGEIIFEYKKIGSIVRVTAIDAATGTEATFQAPSNTRQMDLQRMAVKKLEYVMQKQKNA